MRKERKRISGFDMDLGIGWRTWGYYGRLSKWAFSKHGRMQSSEIPRQRKPAPILYVIAEVTILGLYIQVELYNIGRIKVGTGTGVPPNLLKDAQFVKASKESGLYCWIKTSDAFTYAMTSLQALRLSCRSERYTAGYRKWLKEQDDPIIGGNISDDQEETFDPWQVGNGRVLH